MGKVNLDRYGSRRPKLTLDDLEGGNLLVLTVAAFEEITIEDEEGKRVSPVLEFRETGDKVLWLNRTQVGYLVERLGDESDAWVGQSVPIEAGETTYRGKKFEKLLILPPERWEEAFEQAGLTAAKRKPGRKLGKVRRGKKTSRK